MPTLFVCLFFCLGFEDPCNHLTKCRDAYKWFFFKSPCHGQTRLVLIENTFYKYFGGGWISVVSGQRWAVCLTAQLCAQYGGYERQHVLCCFTFPICLRSWCTREGSATEESCLQLYKQLDDECFCVGKWNTTGGYEYSKQHARQTFLAGVAQFSKPWQPARPRRHAGAFGLFDAANDCAVLDDEGDPHCLLHHRSEVPIALQHSMPVRLSSTKGIAKHSPLCPRLSSLFPPTLHWPRSIYAACDTVTRVSHRERSPTPLRVRQPSYPRPSW